MGWGGYTEIYGGVEEDSVTVYMPQNKLQQIAQANLSNSPTDQKMPNGIRYHMVDIYIDELEKIAPPMAEEGGTTSQIPIEMLLEPFKDLLEKSPTKVLRGKVKAMLEDERIKQWLGTDEEDEDEGMDDSE